MPGLHIDEVGGELVNQQITELNGKVIALENKPEFDQDNKNKIYDVYEGYLNSLDEVGISDYLNSLEFPINTGEKENLYLNIISEEKFRPFITEWNVQANDVVALPVESDTSNPDHDFLVDWGDGTRQRVTSNDFTNATHQYNETGTYQIKISGICEYFMMSDTEQLMRDKVTKVIQWGDVAFRDISFKSCGNLIQLAFDIPNFTMADNLYGCFMSTGITSVPPKLFARAENVTNFTATFMFTIIPQVPYGLFDNAISSERFSSTFYGCGLNAIPEGFFDNCLKVTTFYGCFNYDNLVIIPEGLFDNNTLVENFYNTFNSNNLIAIPDGLFDNCPKVDNFFSTFNQNNITVIPSGLFDKNTEVTTFGNTFSNNDLETIPEGLFDFNIKVESFSNVFFNNNITDIPTDLFKNNKTVTDFRAAFFSNSIEIIPAGLFDTTVEVTTFRQVFEANNITDIPNGLFKNTSKVTTFESTFLNNEIDSIPLNLFDKCQSVDSFDKTFSGNATIKGAAPDLWNRIPEPMGTECFFNCLQLSNYEQIPDSWKLIN